ncbi:hypothetical protein GIB67_034607 [Kingdonia uniflora]|uniref:RING-type domain-containing protein n=1 Tax=Kingdonia uniflora TaxID=39325 RepID=A0A7J7MXJ6_9MAGN|nr:hypothetical protein GIB67_034607 [Kingdonia uniflora]
MSIWLLPDPPLADYSLPRFHCLKKYLPISTESVLKDMAARFEKRMLIAATSQEGFDFPYNLKHQSVRRGLIFGRQMLDGGSGGVLADYIQKISVKMLTLEAQSSTLASSIARAREIASDEGSIDLTQFLFATVTFIAGPSSANLPPNAVTSGGEAHAQIGLPNVDGYDWRTQLRHEIREKIVSNISDTIKACLQIVSPEGLVDAEFTADRLERKIYADATSLSDYLQKISRKLLSMEARRGIAISTPLNSASGNEVPSDEVVVGASSSTLPPNAATTGDISPAVLPRPRKRSAAQLKKQAIKERLPSVDYGTFLKGSKVEGDGGKILKRSKVEEAECSVCLADLTKRAKVRGLKNCPHVFHKRCLDKWINTGKTTCPYCRTAL